MKHIKNVIYVLGLTLLILDNRTAQTGIREGLDLCIKSVIPSLFPFLIFSSLISSWDMQFISRIMRPIGILCGIPSGSESILVLGLLCGYPAGAQMINQAYVDGKLSKKTAQRMLGFCSNAGPAFIFGVCSAFFEIRIIFILWLIQIISALITGFLLPGKTHNAACSHNSVCVSISDVIRKATISMAIICSWILFFRTMLVYMHKWLTDLICPELLCLLSGMLEITNGIFMLRGNFTLGQRLTYTSLFLAFGGLCVSAQTSCVTKKLGMGYYFPGKIIQASVAFILTYYAQLLLLDSPNAWHIHDILILIPIIMIILWSSLLLRKKTVAFSEHIVYNKAQIST